MAERKPVIYRVEEGKVVDQNGRRQPVAVVSETAPKDPLQPDALETLRRWSLERQEKVEENK